MSEDKLHDPTYLDPKLVEVWAKGGLQPLSIGPLDTVVAKALRHRLYTTRTRMRRLHHPEVDKANLATISVRTNEKENQSTLYIYPANSLIEQALANAGVLGDDPPPLE